MDAEREQFLGDVRRQAETACGVLAVCDHEIGRVGLQEAAHLLFHELPPRFADDITDE
jgi:hypothetical protein